MVVEHSKGKSAGRFRKRPQADERFIRNYRFCVFKLEEPNSYKT